MQFSTQSHNSIFNFMEIEHGVLNIKRVINEFVLDLKKMIQYSIAKSLILEAQITK